MQDPTKDIFHSDQAFVKYAASWLIGISLPFLLLGFSCILFSWGYCSWKFVPLFGGLGTFRPEFSTIALPMALLILGLSLNMKTYFGWMVSLMLLTCLDTLFISLAWVLSDHLAYAKAQASADSDAVISAIAYLQESIFINWLFAIICTASVIYLIIPSVRKLYWKAL